MFFNKLKEELREELKEKLETQEQAFLNAADIQNSHISLLIARYKHTKWLKVSSLERKMLEKVFNLTTCPYAHSIGKYYYSQLGYIGDTLSEIEKEQQKDREVIEKIQKPIEKHKDTVTLERIKVILNNQKSTVKAIKAIKQVLKELKK